MKTNVLFITADDLNYNSVGCFGCKVDNITPNIDRLASEGMRLMRGHVTIAVCQPSRQSLMTGRYPHQNGALGFEPIAMTTPTLGEQLEKAGYYKGILGKVEHLQPLEKFCWNYVHNFEFNPKFHEKTGYNGYGRDPELYYEQSKIFFEKVKEEGKPFFLMANSHDPHRPFAGSDVEKEKFGFKTRVSRTYRADEVEAPEFLPDIEDVRKEVAEYFTSVHRLDETVGMVLKALDESGMADNTLVMFLSDNGMAFPFAKTNCYLNSTNTPWVIRWPGKVAPGSVDTDHYVCGIDFMPTILEVLGLPAIDGMNGTSFLPVLFGEKQPGRNEMVTVFNRTSGRNDYPMRAYHQDGFVYLYNAWSDNETIFRNESQSGLTFKAMVKASATNPEIEQRVNLFMYRVKEELYNLDEDPNALCNLIDKPEYQEQVKEMRQKLYNRMIRTNDFAQKSFGEEILGIKTIPDTVMSSYYPPKSKIRELMK